MHRNVRVEDASSQRRHGSANYWLVVDRGEARKALAPHSGPQGETLPILGSREDTIAFLIPLGTFGGEFVPRPVAVEAPSSLLTGPLSGVGTVALDLALTEDTAAFLELVSIDRETFVDRVMNERVSAGARGPAQGRRWSASARISLLVLAVLGLILVIPTTAHAQSGQDEAATEVSTEAELRAAWADPLETSIELTADIYLRQCKTGDPIRESARPMMLDGNGHTIRQTCFEKRVLRQDGTGFLLIKNATLTRGGADGPGAAVTTRGEIKVVDSKV